MDTFVDFSAPLMAAAKKGSVEICEFLLRKGADPKMKDKSGKFKDSLAGK